MKMNLRNLRDIELNDQQRKILMISGIVVGAAALLTYPAILLFRRMRNRRNNSEQMEDNTMKGFAPNYRGNHKPHHRKAEAVGHVHA
jgi:hypothetical protein